MHKNKNNTKCYCEKRKKLQYKDTSCRRLERLERHKQKDASYVKGRKLEHHTLEKDKLL